MIIYENKGYETNSQFPSFDWTGEARFVIEDGSELAQKVIVLYPYYDFILDTNGNLIDVTPTEKPLEPELTPEEKQSTYDMLSIQYIHEKYSYDDENKIVREFVSDKDEPSYKAAFEAYNIYVAECKQRAYKEIYEE